MTDFYVYAYIDPRNSEKFYFGKGKGSRKFDHLNEGGSSAKAMRIAEITTAGYEPIIRVLAAGLTEVEAFNIEAALIYINDGSITNEISGNLSNKFRPKNSLDEELHGFDFHRRLFYFNVGEDNEGHQFWEDFAEFGFIAAGGEKSRWSKAIKSFNVGDIFVAYLKEHGFVGVGRITQKAEMVRDVKIGETKLLDLNLRSKGFSKHANDPVQSDYVCKVEWIKKVDRTEAKFLSKSGLYTPQLVKASLESQPKTIQFLEDEFGISFDILLK